MKKKASPKAAALPRVSTPLEAAVDYPQEGEFLQAGHYAVRVSAPGATEAQISIDEGPWQACRESSGFFWFDWDPEATGGHRIAAQARVGKGRWVKAEPRSCVVEESIVPLA
jgi:hypothetical protein